MRDRMRLAQSGRSQWAMYVIGDAPSSAMRPDAAIISLPVDDWNFQLSPWNAEKCFKNGGDFGGGAGEYLKALVRHIPEFEREHGLAPKRRALCGYSLAGLCALYALYVTDMFDGAVSASGSLWFDRWLDFMEENPLRRAGCRAYLSVGDTEARTRNQRLARVEACTRRAAEILIHKGAQAEFYLEKGNHFCEPDARLARGMRRLIYEEGHD